MTLLRSIATVGSLTMASRVLGLVRDVMIAAILGAGPIADAFFVAFKLPNFFRRLFAEGAFSAAFVPLFADALREGRPAARAFMENVLAILAATLLVFVTAAQIAMPWIMHALAPGFAADPAKFALAVELAQITFPYLLFVSLVAQLGGVLNSMGRFAAAAATPILLNLALIGGLLGLAPFTATPGHALAWGVFAAGIMQFLWLVVACRGAGLAPRLARPRLGPRVRTLLVRMIPGAIGAGAVQINLVVDIVIASFLPTGAISFLYYADRLNQLPLGVIGVAVGTALLPLLSRHVAAGEIEAARRALNRAIEFALFLTVPAALGLIVIAEPIIAVIFERGAFGPAETRATAGALAAYAIGLPAYVLVKALGPGFFARGDTTTPVRIAVIAIAVNTLLAIALAFPLAHVGVALATAIAAWLNATLMALSLTRRGHLALDPRLRRALPRIAVSALAMAGAIYAGTLGLAGLLAGPSLERAAALALLVAAGIVVYGALALATDLAAWADLRRLLGRARRPPGLDAPPANAP